MLIFCKPALQTRKFLFGVEGGPHAHSGRESGVAVRDEIQRMLVTEVQAGRASGARLGSTVRLAAGDAAQDASGSHQAVRPHAHLLLEPGVELAAAFRRRSGRPFAAHHFLLPLLPEKRNKWRRNEAKFAGGC